MAFDRTKAERLMKRCQIGCGGRNALDDAHEIMAECYGTIGRLLIEIDRLTKVESKAEAQAARLSTVTDEAITAFNASPLVKQNGGLLASVHPTVGRSNRQAQVKRCVKVARDICRVSFESEIITPEFWEQFFAICHGDDFLAGRGPKSPGHEGWVSNFEYLTRPATMLKVFEKSEAV